MQHTLLPLPERNALRFEYRVRAASVLLFMLSFAGIIGIVSLFPSFLSMTMRERTELNAVDALKKQKNDNGMADIENGLKSDAALLAATAPLTTGTRASAVIESVVSARGPVSMTSISIVRNAPSTFTISMRGIAPNRDILLAFKSRLEQLAPGNKAVLPISELAKNSNIPFSIDLTEKLP